MRWNLNYIFISSATTILTNINISWDINIKTALMLSTALKLQSSMKEKVFHLRSTGQELKCTQSTILSSGWSISNPELFLFLSCWAPSPALCLYSYSFRHLLNQIISINQLLLPQSTFGLNQVQLRAQPSKRICRKESPPPMEKQKHRFTSSKPTVH